jgi:hypothetical protein
VVDQIAVGEALQGGGDRARGQPEALGEVAGVRVAVARKTVDRLQRLAFALGEGGEELFDGAESRFRSAKTSSPTCP